jgi:HSP20 family protein
MAHPIHRQGGNGDTSLARNDQAQWDPFRLMREMFWDPFREVNDATSRGGFAPTFEMTESADAYVISADLPGVEEEDVDISLTGNRLSISGHREQSRQEEGLRYHTSERVFGRFTRSFSLPDGADPEHLRAEIANGVLTIAVPKKPELQPKRISVAKRATGRGGQKA